MKVFILGNFVRAFLEADLKFPLCMHNLFLALD